MLMKQTLTLLIIAVCCACTSNKICIEDHGSWLVVKQTKGPDLGYSPTSGLKILNVGGYAFKDLNHNDSLDIYEDWRMPVADRAADLASRMTSEEICGLMLYSSALRINDPELKTRHLELLDKNNIRHMTIADIADVIKISEVQIRGKAKKMNIYEVLRIDLRK